MRTYSRSHVRPVQCLGPFVDHDPIYVVEQVSKQGAAISTIGVHLDDFAAWSVLEDIELSGTHGVLSPEDLIDALINRAWPAALNPMGSMKTCIDLAPLVV
jgi:hypothetical protein